MWFILSEYDLLLVMGLSVIIPSIIFLLILWRVPEARAWLKVWAKGGIMVHSVDDSGTYKPIPAKRYSGEGQYISGKDKFGKRIIFQKPRINNPIMTKQLISEGIGCANFFHYAGKTVMVTAETLAAIEVAETPKNKRSKLPKEVIAWAKSENLKIERVIDKEGKRVRQFLKSTIFALDPRKLRYYFREHYDEAPYDALLERKKQEGYEEGKAGKGMEKLMIAIAIGIVAVAILLVVLTKMEVV